MRLTRSRRGVIAIATGAAGGQLLVLAAAPFISRVYSPTDLGVFAVVSSLSIVLGTVAALRYDLAIPIPRADADAYSLAVAGCVSAVSVGVFAAIIVGFAGDAVVSALGEPDLSPWIWTVPLSAVLMGIYTVLNQLATRQQSYGIVGRRSVFQGGAMAITQVGLGAAGVRPGGLVLGFLVGQAAGSASLATGVHLGPDLARTARSHHAVRRMAWRYRRFPLVLAASGLLNVSGVYVPLVLVAYYYDSEVTGWLGLTQRVLTVPVALFGTAVAQVYLSAISRAVRSDIREARRLFDRATRGLLIAGVPMFAFLALLGPDAFALVFGEEWRVSGLYARALSLSLAAQMVGSPLSQTLVVLERVGVQFGWDAARVFLVTASVVGAALAGLSAVAAVWLLGAVSTGTYALSWCLSYWCLRGAVAKETAYLKMPYLAPVPDA